MNPIRNPGTPRLSERPAIHGLELPDVVPVATALAKMVAAARLYPAENPTYLNAKKNFDDAMAGVLQLRHSLRFVVGRRTLLFSGAPVLSDEHGESVAAALHKDGIRELTFHQGLTPEESAGLLALFTRVPPDEERSSDDLRTLFWDRDFTHITCVAIDDLLETEGGSEDILAEFGQDFMPQIDLEVYDLEDEAEVDRAVGEMSAKVLSKLAENDVDLFVVTQEERARLLTEIAAEEDPRQMRHDFARILIHVLLAEDDPASFVDLLGTFSRHMAALLAEGNLSDLAWLLGVLVQLRNERPEMPPEMSEVVEASVSWLWKADARQTLRAKLDRGDMEMLQGLPALVQAVPDESIRDLCLLLGDLETGRVRRRLIDLLVDRCRPNWTVLVPLLSDSRWYLVRNIVLILGTVGNKLIAPPLHRALKHQDYRVRKEALTALERLDPARATSDLKDALRDEERRVRVYAAQTLANRGVEAAPPLLALAEDPSFSGRSDDEVLAIYRALAHAGGNEVLAYLKELVKPRGLLRRGPSDGTRVAACRALGVMRGPQAAAILQSLTQDKTAAVRESAERALAEAKTRAMGDSATATKPGTPDDPRAAGREAA